MAQSDPVLDAFDRLRVREVDAEGENTASTFLARFRSTTASLGPEERIKLRVTDRYESVELLKTVLADPQASKICALYWWYSGAEDVNSVIPLLINSCPELASLQVDFKRRFAFDFVSSVLEYSSSKVKVLYMPPYTGGNLPRFFAALEQSQVLALTLSNCYSPEFFQGLRDYLAKDLLVRLAVSMTSDRLLSEMMVFLADGTCLSEFEVYECGFSQPKTLTHLPKSVTKLKLERCSFVGGFDWSFLTDSSVRELCFDELEDVDGSQLGGVLAVHLRAKGLDELHFCNGDFVDETLAAVGVELGRTKRLVLNRLYVDDDSVELIALALKSPSSELRELELTYENGTMSSIKAHLLPALRHSNCNLAKLRLCFDGKVDTAVEDRLRNRRALLVLLQGQRVRKQYCPLRRLPVEMFRMVGEVLV